MRLTKSQIESHIRAAKKLDKIKDEAFNLICVCKDKPPLDPPYKGGKYLTEYDIQQFILKRFREEGLTMGRMRPIVAVNKNSRDPHYAPTIKKKNSFITFGSLIMIDLWAREKGRNGIYADITWMGYLNDSSPLESLSPACANKKCVMSFQRFRKIFKIVIGARDEAIKFIRKRLKDNKDIYGWEVDEIARNYIEKYGYGKNFIHSTGHSLDKNVHGDGVRLSSIKKKGNKITPKRDKIKILKNMPFTIEPGIYLDNFGVRSELDAYIDDENKLVITTEAQNRIFEISMLTIK